MKQDLPPADASPASAAPGQDPHAGDQRLSAILADLAEDASRDRIAISDMLETMRARAFGALLLIFAFPNILPSPPGLAGVLGLPLVFLSVQMVLGREPWLPQIIAKRSMDRVFFAAMVKRITPWLGRAEGLMHARLEFMAGDLAQRLLGLVCLILAVALALPIPFANLAPSAAICLIGLGILERDGLWIGIGMLASAGALVYVAGLGYALVKSALFVLQNAF
ncbi:exopolysaccharide biosynthesis protein [Pseudogemmobacter humi]|uniref:Exopolysaccharide synthesis, ExoD n=1 Tax=Pseudogemmobacter humi TaxID=2483812 RepID=A0A3P5XMP6_9RHOB|nr:exopolysaccharide biosynthesis protein [Pseudogemmobacter humi]VDC32087.1 Exopolysaccharide synthesis, ExoD [Pseudogemmobacter humi]